MAKDAESFNEMTLNNLRDLPGSRRRFTKEPRDFREVYIFATSLNRSSTPVDGHLHLNRPLNCHPNLYTSSLQRYAFASARIISATGIFIFFFRLLIFSFFFFKLPQSL